MGYPLRRAGCRARGSQAREPRMRDVRERDRLPGLRAGLLQGNMRVGRQLRPAMRIRRMGAEENRIYVVTDTLGNPVFGAERKKDAFDMAVSLHGEGEAESHVFKVVFW